VDWDFGTGVTASQGPGASGDSSKNLVIHRNFRWNRDGSCDYQGNVWIAVTIPQPIAKRIGWPGVLRRVN